MSSAFAAAAATARQTSRESRAKSGPIAQRSEPPAHNRPVPGSNPGGPTSLRPAEAWPGHTRRRRASARQARRAAKAGLDTPGAGGLRLGFLVAKTVAPKLEERRRINNMNTRKLKVRSKNWKVTIKLSNLLSTFYFSLSTFYFPQRPQAGLFCYGPSCFLI